MHGGIHAEGHTGDHTDGHAGRHPAGHVGGHGWNESSGNHSSHEWGSRMHALSAEGLGGVLVYAEKVSEVDKTRGVTSITSFKYPPFLIEPPRFVDETHRAVVRAGKG